MNSLCITVLNDSGQSSMYNGNKLSNIHHHFLKMYLCNPMVNHHLITQGTYDNIT